MYLIKVLLEGYKILKSSHFWRWKYHQHSKIIIEFASYHSESDFQLFFTTSLLFSSFYLCAWISFKMVPPWSMDRHWRGLGRTQPYHPRPWRWCPDFTKWVKTIHELISSRLNQASLVGDYLSFKFIVWHSRECGHQ